MSEPGKVAVVGVGYWGKNLARNFAELGALGAVVDSHPVIAAMVAESNGVPSRTFEDVLADADIGGVVVATSAPTHFELAHAALNAGKHVYVEKPLVLDEREADALIALAADQRRVLMVGHLLRYHPAFRRMLEIVHSGEYGALRYVYSDRLSLGKIRAEENVLWSFAPHDISMVLALAGEEPDRISAQGAAFVNSTIEDVATLQLAFPRGVRASVRVSWLHFRKQQQVVAVCDRGTIVFDDCEPEWSRKLAIHEYAVDRGGAAPVPIRGDVHYVDVDQEEPLKCECRHFLQRMLDGREPLTNGGEGRAVLRVLHLAEADIAAARKSSVRPSEVVR